MFGMPPSNNRVKKPPSTSRIVPEQKWTATGMESLVNLSGVVTRPTWRIFVQTLIELCKATHSRIVALATL
jgi:hypothetical protein